MVFALFGIRPAEATRGLVLDKTATGLRLVVAGAKVDAVRGQPLRVLEVEPTRRGQSALAVAFLRAYVDDTGGDLAATPADVVAVRRAMGQVQPGLSPYAYRHARASDAKATQGRAGVAAWLGHANDRTQSGYGNARSGRGAVAIKTATASRPVRQTKTLPPTLAQRLAQVATLLAARTSSQSATNAPTRRRSPRPRW
jgi:integrase